MSRIKANTDPIFAKIEAHRAAVLAWQAAGDISGKMLADDPAEDAATRATTKASGAEMRALRNLLKCRPTTIAGVVALLDHLGQGQCLRGPDGETVLSGAHCWHNEQKGAVRAVPHMLAGALRSLIGEPPRPAVDEAGSPR
jgi:hypothetical protein